MSPSIFTRQDAIDKEVKMFRTIANLYRKFWSWSHTEIGDGIICFIIMLMAMLAGVAILIYGYVTGFEE